MYVYSSFKFIGSLQMQLITTMLGWY